MEEKHWLDYVMAIASIATPILVIIFAGIGWAIKNAIGRKTELEDKLRNDRIEIYNQILEPFIIILMTDIAWNSDKKNKGKDKNTIAINQMFSLDYRRAGFRLSLMGSDSVVKAYNDLMQFYFNAEESQMEGNDFLYQGMLLLGNFLVEIRKSMGNETTELDGWDMCEWWMTDARKLRSEVYA